MAVSVYPLASQYLEGQRLPADIKPEQWDGFHDLIMIDEIARCGYLGVVWALTCGNSIGAPPLVNFGSEKQKKQFLPRVLNGKTRFCLGVTEPDGMSQFPSKATCMYLQEYALIVRFVLAGSDVAGITTIAERRGDVYIVNGTKKWITNGMFADYCTAAVRTGGEGRKGVSALIISLKVKGVTCKKIENSGVFASGESEDLCVVLYVRGRASLMHLRKVQPILNLTKLRSPLKTFWGRRTMASRSLCRVSSTHYQLLSHTSTDLRKISTMSACGLLVLVFAWHDAVPKTRTNMLSRVRRLGRS